MLKILVIIVMFSAFGFIEHMDYEDEIASVKNYCGMVTNGSLTDYKNIYKTECKIY